LLTPSFHYSFSQIVDRWKPHFVIPREEEAEAWKMGNRSIRTAIQEARNEALEEAENVARN
jgi:hypothetical protein